MVCIALDLPRLLYELVWIVLHAKLTKHEVLGLLKEAELVRALLFILLWGFYRADQVVLTLLWLPDEESHGLRPADGPAVGHRQRGGGQRARP